MSLFPASFRWETGRGGLIHRLEPAPCRFWKLPSGRGRWQVRAEPLLVLPRAHAACVCACVCVRARCVNTCVCLAACTVGAPRPLPRGTLLALCKLGGTVPGPSRTAPQPPWALLPAVRSAWPRTCGQTGGRGCQRDWGRVVRGARSGPGSSSFGGPTGLNHETGDLRQGLCSVRAALPGGGRLLGLRLARTPWGPLLRPCVAACGVRSLEEATGRPVAWAGVGGRTGTHTPPTVQRREGWAGRATPGMRRAVQGLQVMGARRLGDPGAPVPSGGARSARLFTPTSVCRRAYGSPRAPTAGPPVRSARRPLSRARAALLRWSRGTPAAPLRVSALPRRPGGVGGRPRLPPPWARALGHPASMQGVSLSTRSPGESCSGLLPCLEVECISRAHVASCPPQVAGRSACSLAEWCPPGPHPTPRPDFSPAPDPQA